MTMTPISIAKTVRARRSCPCPAVRADSCPNGPGSVRIDLAVTGSISGGRPGYIYAYSQNGSVTLRVSSIVPAQGLDIHASSKNGTHV
jgi:hypothetical protein